MLTRNFFQGVNKITHIKYKKRARRVPKYINTYFVIFLCTFGLDFGFKKTLSKYRRVVFSCIQFCVSIIMCIILLWRISLKKSDYYMKLIYPTQYIMYCTLLLLPKYSVYDLIIDVYSLDRCIMQAVNKKIAIALYIYTILTGGIKQTLCVVNCFHNSTDYCIKPFPDYWYCIPLIGLDAVTIVQMLLCYCVYRSVKYIKMTVRNSDIKSVQDRYHSVVTYCDKIRPMHSALVSIIIFIFINVTSMTFSIVDGMCQN